MKRFGITQVVISALGVLSGLTQGPPSYAQSQTQPQAAGMCTIEGPSVADTLKYINDVPGADGDSWQIRIEGNLLVGYLRPSSNSFTLRRSVTISALKCGSVSGGGNGHDFNIQFRCAAKDCVTESESESHTDVSDSITYPKDSWDASYRLDEDHGQRLVQAFSHLIALLQQQSNQSHSEPGLPRAKP
jgi:hypothetical protein